MEEKEASGGHHSWDWLRLRLIRGVGGVRFARLVEAFGSPQAVLAAPVRELAAVRGVPRRVAQDIADRRYEQDPERVWRRLEAIGARVLTLADADYPPLLKAVYAPPPVLFLRGELGPVRPGGVAVVGSRRASAYGRRVAEELGRDLARAGVSVVSGLARGIDRCAHAAALAAGGHSVGVLGCGLDVAYPPEHAELMEELARRGALLSEYPPGTEPRAGHFPVRNRIISGLCRAVVVEAGLRSGALITARHALDQGREVFAVPGPVGSPGAAGCNELIRQGAGLLTSARDLLAPGAMPPPAEPQAPAPPPGELPEEAARLLEIVGPEPIHVDEITRASGLAPQEVTALLVNLELAGLVEQRPGKYYVRC